MAPHEEVITRLNTIPGVNRLTASPLIAELGGQNAQEKMGPRLDSDKRADSERAYRVTK